MCLGSWSPSLLLSGSGALECLRTFHMSGQVVLITLSSEGLGLTSLVHPSYFLPCFCPQHLDSTCGRLGREGDSLDGPHASENEQVHFRYHFGLG